MRVTVVVVPIAVAIVVAVVVAIGAVSGGVTILGWITAILWEVSISAAFVTCGFGETLVCIMSEFFTLCALDVAFVDSGTGSDGEDRI